MGLFFGAWQVVVWTGWKPEYIVPSPFTVVNQLVHDLTDLSSSAWVTLRRAAVGFALAIVIGGVLGIAVARSRVLRAGVGSMITGLQTMPSVAWYPLALVLFSLSQKAILFVVVLGAAPSIANGIIDGIDHVPPVLLRAGRVLGARGFASLRHVVVPAAMPSVVSGLKQGWAFAWRSLMAGELITTLPGHIGLAQQLSAAAANADYVAVYEAMLVIFMIGVIVDALIFGTAERWIRRRHGLIDAATA
ncbi:MAG TPA: ABC transporter permease [Acidimicrobiia bacterium]|nr:ABC transporter permease [Acidimicrobiia bacterium]